MTWPGETIHVLDFEGGRRSGVVEYGVVTIAGGALVAAHTRLCAPTGAIDVAETAAHGLRERDVAQAAPFSDEWELFTSLRATGPFAAHHAAVERALLRRVWPVPPASPDFSAPAPDTAPRVADWGPWLDTLRLCERLHSALPSHQLMDAIRACGLDNELARLAAAHCPPARRKAHCALHDALAAALLLMHLGMQRADLTLAGLLALASPSADEPQREFALGE